MEKLNEDADDNNEAAGTPRRSDSVNENPSFNFTTIYS